MSTTPNKWRLTGGLICTIIGVLVLYGGIWLAKYDIGHGEIVVTTFLVAIIGAIIILAGISTLYGTNYGPQLALVGSGITLTIIAIATKGNPKVLLNSSIALLFVVIPVAVSGLSIWFLWKKEQEKRS